MTAKKAEPAPKKESAPKSSGRKGGFASGLKTFVIALVLALLVRVFVFEIFKIPSCSMEPTLQGIDFSHGDRVGVNKLAYLFSDIDRFDVIVFSSDSIHQGKKVRREYIKRVAGFGGEELSFADGDLLVNGKLAPKPAKVQDSLWVPVYSESFDNPSWQRFWEVGAGKATLGESALKLEGAELKYVHWERTVRDGNTLFAHVSDLVPRLEIIKEVVCPSCGEKFRPTWRDCFIESDAGTGEVKKGFVCPKCGDHILYDGRNGDRTLPQIGEPNTDFWLSGRSVVGDLALGLTATPRGRSGKLVLRIERGSQGRYYDPHTVELPIGPGNDAVYRSLDTTEKLSELARLRPDQPTRLDFRVWDGTVQLLVNGEEALRTSFVPGGRPLEGNSISITVSEGVSVDIDDVAIRRDIYYLPGDIDPARNPMMVEKGRYNVPEGHFFMLGDNSGASNDNRFLLPPVAASDVVGRAFAVIWPLRNLRWLPRAAESDGDK